MRSTLFFIPHELFGIPVLGFGWGLLLILVWSLFWIGWNRYQTGHWKAVQETLPLSGIVAVLILFVFPNIETRIPDGTAQGHILGMPVRGYGLMLMLGAISGVAITSLRSRKLGISTDDLLSLAFWCCSCGILGARIFYVVQKWSELPGGTFFEKLITSLKFTEGGLVIYGGMIGGIVAIYFWCMLRRLRPFAVFDLVAPGFMIGLCFGRIGCFLHGCCFGGVCQVDYVPSVRFPGGSEPYLSQVVRGELLGLTLSKPDSHHDQEIQKIEPGSWAEKIGLIPGQKVKGIHPEISWPGPGEDPAGPQTVHVQVDVDNRIYSSSALALPAESLPLHPAQLYSSLNALLIACILFFYWPLATRDGYVLALGLCLYAGARIIEEWIRVDELGQFGTQLTIAQWISLVGGIIGIGIFFLQRSATRRPAEFQDSIASRR